MTVGSPCKRRPRDQNNIIIVEWRFYELLFYNHQIIFHISRILARDEGLLIRAPREPHKMQIAASLLFYILNTSS